MLVAFPEETMMARFMMSSAWLNLYQPHRPLEDPHVREKLRSGQPETYTSLDSLCLVNIDSVFSSCANVFAKEHNREINASFIFTVETLFEYFYSSIFISVFTSLQYKAYFIPFSLH